MFFNEKHVVLFFLYTFYCSLYLVALKHHVNKDKVKYLENNRQT
jgi:hypothetical protein